MAIETDYDNLAFFTLITSSLILITNVIGSIYEILAKKYENGSDEVSIIGSILSDDIALSTPPQSNFTPPSDSDEVKVPLQIGSILPDGTVLPKPPPQLNFIPARDSDEHMMKNHIAVLTVPALDEEMNAFIADVEKVRLRLCQL
ncbi:18431_t:CDS:2 [Rhizophagus irregularis]|nr:18431_t:CDS:2 [Rhizophagus irregularis]